MQESKKKYNNYKTKGGFPGGSVVKNQPAKQEEWV